MMRPGVISDPSFRDKPRPWVADGGVSVAQMEDVATLLAIIAQSKAELLSPDHTAEEKIEAADCITQAMKLCEGWYDGPWPNAMKLPARVAA